MKKCVMRRLTESRAKEEGKEGNRKGEKRRDREKEEGTLYGCALSKADCQASLFFKGRVYRHKN